MGSLPFKDVSRARKLQNTMNIAEVDADITYKKQQRADPARYLDDLISSTRQHLELANDVIAREGLTQTEKLNKNLRRNLVDPIEIIIDLVDAFADLHPVVKLVTGVVKVVVTAEMRRHENDKKIVVLLLAMTSLLFLLNDLHESGVLDEKHDQHARVKKILLQIGECIKEFGSFCEVYYSRSPFVKIVWSLPFKTSLTQYADTFERHKKEFRVLLDTICAKKITNIETDIARIRIIVESSSNKEREASVFMSSAGRTQFDVTNPEDAQLLRRLAEQLNLKYDSTTEKMLQDDLQELLTRTFLMYEKKLQRSIEDALIASTRTIVTKMGEGPHDDIDDPDIRAVWEIMRARTSVKSPAFLDAVYDYFRKRDYARMDHETKPSADRYMLYFLSNFLFYPSIAEGIDLDSSGFISVYEINKFVKSKPDNLNYNVASWFAFWAIGPNRTYNEYCGKIQTLIRRFSQLEDNIRDSEDPEISGNLRRVQYLGIIRTALSMLSVHATRLPGYRDEPKEVLVAYKYMETMRKSWRDWQLEYLDSRLNEKKYEVSGRSILDYIIGSNRLEHSIMAIVFILLRRHLKVVKLATREKVSVLEFLNMRDSWDHIFTAIDKRYHILKETWKQQRLEIDVQVQRYCGGLFEYWHAHRDKIFMDEMDDDLPEEEYYDSISDYASDELYASDRDTDSTRSDDREENVQEIGPEPVQETGEEPYGQSAEPEEMVPDMRWSRSPSVLSDTPKKKKGGGSVKKASLLRYPRHLARDYDDEWCLQEFQVPGDRSNTLILPPLQAETGSNPHATIRPVPTHFEVTRPRPQRNNTA